MSRIYVLIGTVLITLAAVFWIFFMMGTVRDLRSQLEVSQARVLGLQEANRVLGDHYKRVEEDREHWRQVAADLEREKGIEDTLNDYERAVLDRLLTQGGARDTGPAPSGSSGALRFRDYLPSSGDLRSPAP